MKKIIASIKEMESRIESLGRQFPRAPNPLVNSIVRDVESDEAVIAYRQNLLKEVGQLRAINRRLNSLL